MTPFPSIPQQPSKLSIDLLGPDHHRILAQAIRNVLSTDLALITMAQLVDGLPLEANGWDAQGSLLIHGHPLIGHDTLCHGVIERTTEFRDASDERTLCFDVLVCSATTLRTTISLTRHLQALQAYQNAEVNS